MNTPENNKNRAWDLVKKASGILKTLRNEPSNKDDTIRPLLVKGLNCIQEYLQIADCIADDFDASMISTNVMSLSYFLRSANPAEFQYTVNRLIEWKNKGYKDCNNALALILTCELRKDETERRLNLTDRQYVVIITGCNATIGCGLSGMLYIHAVRDFYIKKATEGEYRYIFTLGTYYYEAKEYTKAFNTLKDLTDCHTAKYLGLMYYYGKGTEENHELAREYLENYYNIHTCAENEVVWALGELYGRYESKHKQFEFYVEHLESPYRYDDEMFIKRMLEQCVLYKRSNSTKDCILMTVKIKQERLECEFSLDLAPYCHIIVDWGDGKCDRYGDLDKTGTLICRHIYEQPESYSVNIKSLWECVVEGLDFSRNKRQLHSIYLSDCSGLRRLSIVGQCITSLDFTPSGNRKGFLTGVICRDNLLTKLDLRPTPNITHLDCSFNPITVIKLPKRSSLSIITIPESFVNRSKIDELLRMNRGCYCNQIDYNDLSGFDMRLEFYFRQANWDKVRRYIRKHQPDYYDHQLAECESAFQKLKELSQEVNPNPYEDKGGFLALHDSYVSDDTILHHEEFFIEEESWTTCLATKVRDTRRREPWMGFPPTPPEYYVANCLVNMITSWREIKNHPVRKNETGND